MSEASLGAASSPGSVPNRTFDILGVGDADVDIYVEVDRMPRPGEKVAGTHLGLHPGGVVANFCAATAKLGLRTALVSVVGDDAFGAIALEDLRGRGVDVERVSTLEGASTYLGLVSIDPHGEKALTIAVTSAMFPSAEQVTDADLRETRHVHLAPFDLGEALATARRAREVGATVSVDLEPTSMQGDPALLDELVRTVDVLLPNSHAIETWLGETPSPETARHLLSLGPRLVAIGCGADGVIVAVDEEAVAVPAYVTQVRDTTGAGDVLNASIVFGWLQGWSAPYIARFAAAAAAHVVATLGSRPGQPTLAQVESFLAERGAA